MRELVVVIGYGPVGKAVTEQLVAMGRNVRVVQRTPPEILPDGATYRFGDVADEASLQTALDGAHQVVLAIGLAYDSEVWRAQWPVAMANVLAACERAQTRLVFVDNLYMLGPQVAPLREDMEMSPVGVKPSARAVVTRLWQAADAEGRVRVAALRAPDFYGPGVAQSHLGTQAFGAIKQNKPALLLAPPDLPHAFAYVPDIARAVVTLLNAPDDAYGQAWNVPCAPTKTLRALLQLGADELNRPLKLVAFPFWLQPLVGWMVPFVNELKEMRFQWDRPYHVDHAKFAARFWGDATPFEIGVRATMQH